MEGGGGGGRYGARSYCYGPTQRGKDSCIIEGLYLITFSKTFPAKRVVTMKIVNLSYCNHLCSPCTVRSDGTGAMFKSNSFKCSAKNQLFSATPPVVSVSE